MLCSVTVCLMVLVIKYELPRRGAAMEPLQNRFRYSSDHPQTVTACRYGNINDERAAYGLLEAEVCDEVGELSCTRRRGLVQEIQPLE